MAHLFADENFPYGVVEGLRNLGHDALTVQEAGLGNRSTPDADILAYAVQQGRAVLTLNRLHYKRLHRQVQPHFGIIICTRDDDAVALADRIHQAIVGCPNLTGQLLRVYRPWKP